MKRSEFAKYIKLKADKYAEIHIDGHGNSIFWKRLRSITDFSLTVIFNDAQLYWVPQKKYHRIFVG